MEDKMDTVVFTTAPAAADYDYTATELETFQFSLWGSRAKTWRKVRLCNGAYQVKYQCDRYRSFLGGAPFLDDPRQKDWQVSDCGLTPAPTNYTR